MKKLISTFWAWLGYDPGPAVARSEPPNSQDEPTTLAPTAWVPRAEVGPVDAKLRLEDWRRSDPLVKGMRQFLDGRFGQDVISCLVNECRVRQGIPQPDKHVIGIELGRIAGHQEVIDILVLMADPIVAPEQIPVTYPAPEAFPQEE